MTKNRRKKWRSRRKAFITINFAINEFILYSVSIFVAEDFICVHIDLLLFLFRYILLRPSKRTQIYPSHGLCEMFTSSVYPEIENPGHELSHDLLISFSFFRVVVLDRIVNISWSLATEVKCYTDSTICTDFKSTIQHVFCAYKDIILLEETLWIFLYILPCILNPYNITALLRSQI